MGNNEVIGSFGAGLAFTPFSANLFLIRSRLSLLHWKFGQWLQQTLDSLSSQSDQAKRWKGMETLSEKNEIASHDARLDKVYQHFSTNVYSILAACQKRQVPVLVCTLGTNLKDCPPFASLHAPGMNENTLKQWDTLVQQGIAAENQDHHPEAMSFYQQAESLDPHYAELNYRMGQCLLKLENIPQAKDYFVRARDGDALRFRADTEINRRIRESAQACTGVFLVDMEKRLEQESPLGILGEEFLYEHVHFNFDGNYLAARALLDAATRFFPTQIRSATDTAILSEKECKDRLAYTFWDRYKSLINIIARKKPFRSPNNWIISPGCEKWKWTPTRWRRC